MSVDGRVIVQFTAKSQAVGAMGNAEFQASKDAVLGILAEMIGIDPTKLMKAGQRSAA